MKIYAQALIFSLFIASNAQSVRIVDSLELLPVPYATISFGDGMGTFADGEGRFVFVPKRYPGVDTLYISAIGYAEKTIAVESLKEKIHLRPEISELSEVVVSAPRKGKFRLRKQKPGTHNDVFGCWLPTVESEVAVYFGRYQGRPTQISKLLLPINAESQYKSKGKGKYATIFRIQFYENDHGSPGAALPFGEVVFSIDEKADKVFELDVRSKSIYIPERGIYCSLQVLGYADKEGGLAQSKKYREIKTPRGIQKISTSFRPLLPFSKGRPDQSTYVRRIFLNNKKWQVFDRTYNKNSNLIQTGHRNYAMGAEFKVYED